MKSFVLILTCPFKGIGSAFGQCYHYLSLLKPIPTEDVLLKENRDER
jgi:hypothetical protein